MHKFNIHIRTDREQALKNSANENYFEVIDTEEKAYWLGFFYADGYIVSATKHKHSGIGISLSECDKAHLEKFKKAINYSGEIKRYIVKNNTYNSKPYCRILISSEKLANDLNDKGCYNNKTLILQYPTDEQVPKHLQKHFIRGYIDGDGSITSNKNKQRSENDKFFCGFELKVVGTKEVLTGILKAFNKQELKLGQRFPERNNNNYCFGIGGNVQVLTVLDWLYKDATIFLDRKYEKYLYFSQLYKTWKEK